jgi:hypothetical protein
MSARISFVNDLDALLLQARTARAADIDAAHCNTPSDHERSRKERRKYDKLREVFIESWSPPSDDTMQQLKEVLSDALEGAKKCNASLDNALASLGTFNKDLKDRLDAEEDERL